MKRISSCLLAIAFAVLFSSWSEVARAATAKIPASLRQSLQDRDYPVAIKLIDAELKKKDAPADYLLYLKGRALHFQRKFDQAAEVFDLVEKNHPRSSWARQARFAKGAALARKGDFRSAELIYRAEANYLLSVERKQEIADIYLEFADAYFKPPKENQKPDYQKALQFYGKALEVGPQPERRTEVELLVARCFQNLGNDGEAIKRFTKFSKDYPDNPLDLEARYRLGWCQMRQGMRPQARRTWQDMLAKYVNSQSERIAEARFGIASTYGVPQPPSSEDLSLGVAALEAFIERHPQHKRASEAFLLIARSYAARGQMENAVSSLQRFLKIERYQERPEVPEARFLLGQTFAVQEKFDEALATWREYLAKHPTHRRWSQAQKSIIDTEYRIAAKALTSKKYEDARRLWNQFLVKYPLDSRASAILYQFGKMQYDQKKFDEAIAEWQRLVSKYPGTNPASLGQLMIGITLEDKQSKFAEAIEQYKKVTWGSSVNSARQRIGRLTAKKLTIATERAFRTDETPQIALVARNIESVTVRAYTIDLETYFRKMHLASGVEKLDVSLIDPDKTFEFKVPDYEKYQQHGCSIPLELLAKKGEPGVLAVTVSSKTLEATTMVVRSDLDVIVKSSREEVFVFAENMRTGKAWPEARLLVSDGKEVFAEAVTEGDGVFQHEYEKLKGAQDLRVFAVADGHVASNVVGLSGVGVSRGLANKGYIYTERPAYRPGQMVNLRGVIRCAAGDAYIIDEGKEFDVNIYDTRSRLIWQSQVKLNEFGSFHAHFVLPPDSPQGQYRILVKDKTSNHYNGSFQVHQFTLATVHLMVDTPRQVYYRGEEIEGTISAKFYYGAPLAGREIRYRLAGDRVHTAKTDAKGEVKFKLPTREFRESAILPLSVSLPERNLNIQSNFVLATQGFSVSLTTPRSVFLAGEAFETKLVASDAEGKPVARKLTLSVLQRTTVDGRVGERLVEKYEIETDEKTGTARQTLNLDKGAIYILRAEGTDRFRNPIIGEHSVTVSGDADTVRLRILSDGSSYKVGDTATMRLHWREKPALALVTFQGAKVLDYRLVELKTGENALKIPMQALYAPGFDLTVNVMTDPRQEKEAKDKTPPRRFHYAKTTLHVRRQLIVKLTTQGKDPKKQPRPGEPIEVTITTTDPQGKPVSAEVSLAMVEKSLLDRFGPEVTSIDNFFRGLSRLSAIRTQSSVTFAYRPGTRAINARLLAEKDRLELEKEESERLTELRHAAREPARAEGNENDSDDFFSAEMPADQPAPVLEPPTSGSAIDGISLGQQRPTGNGSRRYSSATNAPNAPALQSGLGGGGFFGPGNGRQGQNASSGESQQAQQTIMQDELVQLNWDANANWELQSDRTNSVFKTPTARQLLDFSKNVQAGDVLGVQSDGTVQYWNFQGLKQGDAEKLSRQIEQTGTVLVPRFSRQETGYWNPSILTGKDGKQTVTITLPSRSTAWNFWASGITVDTLAGEAEDELTVKKDLFGELKLPLAFTDGDQAQIVATVHNQALKQGKIEVSLKTTIGGKSTEDKKTLDVKDLGPQQLVFATQLDRPEGKEAQKIGTAGPDVLVELVLTIASGDKKDVIHRVVPLRPYGMPVFRTASGSAQGDTTAWVELPETMPVVAPSLQVIVGPSMQKSLMDVVLSPGPWCQIESNRFASGLDTGVSTLMASLGLQELLGGSRDAENPQAQALDSRIRGSVGLLISSQRDDGGWSWAGKGGNSNRYITSRIVWALSLARKSGYTVPEESYSLALNYLVGQIAKTQNTDLESKAVLLHGLAVAGRGDFSLANRLFRSRQSLSNAGRVQLAMALTAMDRKPMAEEILGLVATEKLAETAPKTRAGLSSLPWNHSPAEVRALYLLALQEIKPADARVKELADWLLAHRTGHRWSPDKATGPATLGLCRYYAKSKFETEKYTLEVFVNDNRVEKIEVNKDAVTQTIQVPANFLLKKGKQRVNFELTGRGEYTFQCILGGFVAADKLKNTTRDWRVFRYYEPAPLEVDGKPVPRGFNVVRGSYQSFRNPLTQLPVGKRGQVRLTVYRDNVPSGARDEQMEYLVITEPLASGTTVVENSVKGGFERYEIGPGAITFYVGNRRYISTIQYDVHGYLPGKYRTAPTVIRDAYRPDLLAVSTVKPLTVLPLGAKSADKYRLTPQELFELGKQAFAKNDWKTASTHLTDLNTTWSLDANIYKQVIQMLLDSHLEIGPASKVVGYFEIIKEKWVDLEIPYDKILKVGAAYHEMGEYERSHRIFRATVESSFLRESRVAGFLQSQGEFLRSVDTMGRLLREYPPEPYVATATYSLAQQVYIKAPQAAKNARLREKKINRVDLVQQALGMLESFLTEYPEDPAADEASFSVANAMLELKLYQEAITASNRYAERYPESEYLDSYWYTIGFCHFARGEHKSALEMCRKVADTKRRDPKSGQMVDSVNHWRAIYILGQIYHSLGQAAEAIKEYTRVEKRFADAKQAIAYFARRDISLPEVTTIEPGKPASVELKFRNIAQCDTKVYRIDLMKFSLLKRDLSGITRINLAGIRPLHEAETELGDGKDYRDRKHALKLPLKEEGAYLVVCRGDNLHASGLVLVTPLKVDVREDSQSGRVRTTVKDVVKNQYISEVHVKVIGSSNPDFISGETDLRGVFVADDIRGKSTVIAQADGGRYAFFRGKVLLGNVPQNSQSNKKPDAAKPSQKKSGGKGKDLLKGLQDGNYMIQRKQQEYLQKLYDNNDKGVKVKAAL